MRGYGNETQEGYFQTFYQLSFQSIPYRARYILVPGLSKPDQSPNPSICHAISATRYNVLEPYAYPLIKLALSCPPIEPYVREIEPYAIHAHHTLQPFAAATVAKFSTHVVPEWNNHIVPQYYTYVAPHIQSALAYLDPYLAVVGTEYERYLAPYLHVSATTAWENGISLSREERGRTMSECNPLTTVLQYSPIYLPIASKEVFPLQT
jgi:hypothetical protein